MNSLSNGFSCGPYGNFNYLYGIHAVYYLLAVINFIAMFLICIRLIIVSNIMILFIINFLMNIKIKKRTHLRIKSLLFKQIRLIIFWLYFIAFVSIFVYVTISRHQSEGNGIQNGIQEYVLCIFTNAGDADKCNFDEYFQLPAFKALATMGVLITFYPILVFLLFGTRKSIFLFWKEYIKYIWNEKTITFQFRASFDQALLRSSIQTIESLRESRSESPRILISDSDKLKEIIQDI